MNLLDPSKTGGSPLPTILLPFHYFGTDSLTLKTHHSEFWQEKATLKRVFPGACVSFSCLLVKETWNFIVPSIPIHLRVKFINKFPEQDFRFSVPSGTILCSSF